MSDSNNNNNDNDDEVFKPQLIPSSLILDATMWKREKKSTAVGWEFNVAKQIMAIFDDIKPGEGGGK